MAVLDTTIGGVDSNSYATAIELVIYAGNRGIIINGNSEELLIEAMDLIEGYTYKGDKKTDEQALQWPRYSVEVDGYYVLNTTIPRQLKEGQYEAALALDAGSDLLETLGRATKSEKVGELTVTYMDAASDSIQVKKITNKIRKLLISNTTRVFRA